MIDTDKYERHLGDALICVREGGVDCDFTKIRLEDALENMADLLAEVKQLRKQLSKAKNWVRDYLTDINGNYLSYENRVLHDDFTQQVEAKKND